MASWPFWVPVEVFLVHRAFLRRQRPRQVPLDRDGTSDGRPGHAGNVPVEEEGDVDLDRVVRVLRFGVEQEMAGFRGDRGFHFHHPVPLQRDAVGSRGKGDRDIRPLLAHLDGGRIARDQVIRAIPAELICATGPTWSRAARSAATSRCPSFRFFAITMTWSLPLSGGRGPAPGCPPPGCPPPGWPPPGAHRQAGHRQADSSRRLPASRAACSEPRSETGTADFFHCALVRDEKGQRLAKRHDALSLRALREQGKTPEKLRQDWAQ